MTDRELLELAAKAAGLLSDGWHRDGGLACWEPGQEGKYWFNWNPLESDSDALRLAVKMGMCVDSHINDDARAYAENGITASENRNPDPYAATRRAIVRAAAEIGRTM